MSRPLLSRRSRARSVLFFVSWWIVANRRASTRRCMPSAVWTVSDSTPAASSPSIIASAPIKNAFFAAGRRLSGFDGAVGTTGLSSSRRITF